MRERHQLIRYGWLAAVLVEVWFSLLKCAKAGIPGLVYDEKDQTLVLDTSKEQT